MKLEYSPILKRTGHFAELIFTKGIGIGIILIICTLCNLNIALSGLIAMASLMVFISISGIKTDNVQAGLYTYNPVLVGMAIGAIFKVTPSVIVIICVCAILTFLLTIALAHLFHAYGIPILSLPFACVSTALYLASSGYSKLFSLAHYDTRVFASVESHLPEIPAAFFKSLGTILFMPNVIVGAVIFSIILISSRILAAHAVMSFLVGVFLHSLLATSWQDALVNPYSFNYILVGMALGGTFFIPSLRTTIICLLGVAVSVLLVDVTSGFAQLFNIPVFTMPFNITVILFVFALRMIHYPDFNYDIRPTPEASLCSALSMKTRFKSAEVSIGLPLTVPCSIYQEQNGEWTHRGKWRYAYDFIIKQDGEMSCDTGSELTDYFVFGAEVVSPVAGYVTACCTTLPDNPIGRVDQTNNWGNYVIIRTTGGWHVELSHFQHNSLGVVPGDYVVLGQYLGRCGNSGFSPVPHLHVQAQQTGFLGDETIPFNFAAYMADDQVMMGEKPPRNARIQPIAYCPELHSKLTFNLGTVFTYIMSVDGEETGTCTLTVRRCSDTSGRIFIDDGKGSRLYFTISNGSFYVYDFTGATDSPLRYWYLALPRLPLIATPGHWQETIPFSLAYSGFQAFIAPLKAWLNPGYTNPCGNWHYDANGTITGTLFLGNKELNTKTVLNASHGIDELVVGSIKLKQTGGIHA